MYIIAGILDGVVAKVVDCDIVKSLNLICPITFTFRFIITVKVGSTFANQL